MYLLYMYFISEKGFRNVSKKVPDTITSWIISGFSLSSFYGLGISDPTTKLTVFQPFFVTLNLPYSIKRGEILNVQVLVFNYIDSEQHAEVTFFNDENEFEFLDSFSKSPRVIRKNLIPPQNGVSFTFMIRPLKVGHITIKVVAMSAVAGDGVEQKLLVEPEGVTQYINKAVFIDLRNSPEFKTDFTITIPPNAVPDSTKIEASAIGDILGPSIENLDKLM
jgi:CD109 antigen